MDSASLLGIAQTVAIFVTGGALAYFAYLTYQMSKQVTNLRYSPILEICPSGLPKVGTFDVKITTNHIERITYQGVKWEIYLMNPGDVPVFAEDIEVFIRYRPSDGSRDEVLMSISKLCDLLDETGNMIDDRSVWVAGHDQYKVTVLMCRKQKIAIPDLYYKPGDTVKMSLEFYQKRGLNRQPGRIEKTSEAFQLPDRFEVEKPMGGVEL